MPQIYDMGPTALLPLRRKARWEFFRPKNPTTSAGFEPANLGTKGQHATPRPPKPHPAIYGGNFCLALGSTGIIYMRHQQPLCCVLVSSNLRLHLAAFCLCSFIVTEPSHRWRQKDSSSSVFFLALKLSYRHGFLRIRKTTLGVSPWEKKRSRNVSVHNFRTYALQNWMHN